MIRSPLTVEWLSSCPVLHTYTLVHLNLTIQHCLGCSWINLVWAAAGMGVNTMWAHNCKLHVHNLISSCAHAVTHRVTKISSIKHVLEFYKLIKTEIVCVFVCSSGFKSPNFSSGSSTQSPYGFTTTPPKSSILLSGTELVCLWYRCMCASMSVQLQHENKPKSLFCVHGKKVLDWRINFLKAFFLSLWRRTYVLLVWVKNC